MKTRPWIDRSELRKAGSPEAENAILAASSILFQLSGQRFGGIWTITEQYTCDTSGPPTGCAYDPGVGGYWNPAVGAYTFVLGRSTGPRRMGPGGDIRLRHRPVRGIVSLTVNGAVVDPSQYFVLNRSTIRMASTASWGLCSSPVVTYDYGTDPPHLARMAARTLADELILAYEGDDNCKLPSSVTSVSRQGLSFSIFDPQDFLKDGFTGMYEVDLFLKTVNPSRAVKRPAVFSPDLPRGRHRS